jgi:hypothetical protein
MKERRRDYQQRNKSQGLCTKCKKKAHKWGLCILHFKKQKVYYRSRVNSKQAKRKCFWCSKKAVTKWFCEDHLKRSRSRPSAKA